MFTKVKDFFKKETVCCIAFLLAVVSMFFIPPSVNYFSYIDFRVLALLFSLMAVVRGFSSIGVFTRLGTLLLHKVHSLRTLAALFVFLCFFFSMLITNDVALITFVPFTILVLSMADQRQALIPVIVLETIAANLGSMLTPLGNPQNLYLYTISGLSLWDFIRIMLPYSAVSALLLILFLLVLPKASFQAGNFSAVQTESSACSTDKPASSRSHRNPRILFAAYCILFLICLLTVLHILPFQIMLLIVFFGFLILDYHVLKDVDYFLLLTFLCFFIFIGNMKQISLVHELISKLLVHHEVLMGIGASQIISNVPAAILLSGFTNNYSALLIGVNLGGLGTLIASLASLISFKFYANSNGSDTRRFLGIFTLYNVIFLGVLFILSLILC
ncbi:SLC13 family permease [Roseburia sp. AF20-18LB]|uniref:SLC13 family permease n=1 Tax=Roseburia sp. AF20-18LB TaxID=2293129 RepID=UPI000E48E37C|nr:SLC13 family permease [Roseburia sp. AF20-18LB]RGG47926.1 citrate transporter [Roseburia sp. AF20-18LB]